jgi:hypothetical protein
MGAGCQAVVAAEAPTSQTGLVECVSNLLNRAGGPQSFVAADTPDPA